MIGKEENSLGGKRGEGVLTTPFLALI